MGTKHKVPHALGMLGEVGEEDIGQRAELEGKALPRQMGAESEVWLGRGEGAGRISNPKQQEFGLVEVPGSGVLRP